MVESRCAMAKLIRPWNIALNPCWILLGLAAEEFEARESEEL
jgi:hypothetical protein